MQGAWRKIKYRSSLGLADRGRQLHRIVTNELQHTLSGNPWIPAGGKGHTYSYGNILTATGSLADVNPLRYRGYVYDTETQFYYLQSRYYDPELGRFINADSITSTGQGILGNNMFAYCGNSPTNLVDETGCISTRLIAKGLVSGFTEMITTWVFGGSTEEILWSFVTGFISGVGQAYSDACDFVLLIWDVGKAVYGTWKTGGSFFDCLAVGGTLLYTALSCNEIPDSILQDLTLKYGISLVGTGVYEGYQMKHYEKSDDRVFTLDWGNYSLVTNAGGYHSSSEEANLSGLKAYAACTR